MFPDSDKIRQGNIYRPLWLRWNSPERHIYPPFYVRWNLKKIPGRKYLPGIHIYYNKSGFWFRRLPVLLQLSQPGLQPRVHLQPVPSSLRTVRSLRRGVLQIPDRCSLC